MQTQPLLVYIVALRVFPAPSSLSPELNQVNTYGPSPVVALGSLNGIVGGLPTHYIVFTGIGPNFYQVYEFPLQTPTTNDPSPINLAWPGVYVGDVIAGSGIDPTNGGTAATNGNQLGFAIDTSYLNPYYNTPVTSIQFNIITATKRLVGDASGYVMDAIGDQSNVNDGTFVNPVYIPITTSGTYTDQTVGVPERAGDTYPPGSNYPAIDMSGWSCQVSLP